MRDCALQWHHEPSSATSEYNLVAGSGLGVSHGLSCRNAPCIIKKIDSLYRHAWHYFDYIYLPDAAGDLIRESECPTDRELDRLAELIESAMYLRGIGAENLTRYYSVTRIAKSNSKTLPDRSLDSVWADLRREFLSYPERFHIAPRGGTFYSVSYADDRLEFSPTIELDLKSIPKSERRGILHSFLADEMVKRHRKSFLASTRAAQELGGAIGSTIWSHEWALTKAGKETTDNTVFFRMDFPSLQNVAVSDLISLRLEHRDSFIACRMALRKAVQDLSASPGLDRNNLAAEIVRDVVEPEVARLNNKLEAARRVLTKKSAVALAIASVSTWCGVQLGWGPAASLGVGALAALGTGIKDAAFKYSEEKRDLEISDMSFLWKAVKCADR
jgi:hypothetical protein